MKFPTLTEKQLLLRNKFLIDFHGFDVNKKGKYYKFRKGFTQKNLYLKNQETFRLSNELKRLLIEQFIDPKKETYAPSLVEKLKREDLKAVVTLMMALLPKEQKVEIEKKKVAPIVISPKINVQSMNATKIEPNSNLPTFNGVSTNRLLENKQLNN